MYDTKVEYVRTEDGKIIVADGKYYRMSDSKAVLLEIFAEKPEIFVGNSYIVKTHSENLIDLIEVGDYVNGKYVYDVFEAVTSGGKLVKVDCMRGYYKPEEIEEIVTHEQFDSMKYVVGGKE